MQVINLNNIIKNPAHGGIFCFKTIVVALLLMACSIGFAQPRIKVTEPRKNFGFVKRGTLVKNEYEIINAGDQPLIITEAEVSCSCTTVDLPKQPVLPGQSATVVVSFNTTTVYGRQDRVVLINSNDPKGAVKLRYKGTVSDK